MTTQRRKATFRDDIIAACNKIPGGSTRYRAYLQSTTLSLVEDFSATGTLPMRFKNIKIESISKLVTYWQKKRFLPKTIKNKLSVLRALIKASGFDLNIPSNRALNVKITSYHSRIAPVKILLLPNEIDSPPIKVILQLQFLFGLKKYEALRFNGSMIKEITLEIPRNISYNKKDRFIPIITAAQKNFVESFRVGNQNSATPDRRTIRGLALIHSAALKTRHISHSDYFRHQYGLNRFITLQSESLPVLEVLQKVASEMGYCRLDQVREILECLNNS